MLEIAQLVGLCVIAYFLLVGIVMLFTKSSIEDARKIISSFFQRSYELSRDENYIKAVNDIVKDILGEVRYVELCTLNKYSNTLQLAHIINRTRRRDIGNFTLRKPETLKVSFTPEQQERFDRKDGDLYNELYFDDSPY